MVFVVAGGASNGSGRKPPMLRNFISQEEIKELDPSMYMNGRLMGGFY